MATRRTDRERLLILGAAGRDFHDFNVLFRDDPSSEVVAFTAAQIPGIDQRCYPASLAGPLYPDGIPIEPESELEALCRERRVDRVALAYSDLSHAQVMHLASRALATGADWTLPGPRRTMLHSSLPVVAVSAVRTGCGKSQTARWLALWFRDHGIRVASLRHPMPYGDLERQRLQRFATHADLDAADCTAEEREEYEPYVEAGSVIFAGVDYAAILARAEREAQVILWDGGNNDFPFVAPDLHLVLVDALRPDQVASHFPGEVVMRMADVVIVNKVDSAEESSVQRTIDNVRALRPDVPIVRAASPPTLENRDDLRGKRVVVVDDGPTLTHGGMAYGAGWVAAVDAGAEIVDPRPHAAPALRRVFDRYPHLDRVVPAVGYGPEQRAALAETLEAVDADAVVSGTPLDLARLVHISKPIFRARYAYADAGEPRLERFVQEFIERHDLRTHA
jgi:predicted GTPase